MPSIVELIFESRGIEPTADAVKRLSAAIDDNAKALARQGVTSVAAAQGNEALARVMKEQAAAHAQAALGAGTFGGQLRNLSAEVTDRLTPALDATSQKLIAVGAAALSAKIIYEGFKGAISDGAELEHLHMRTGELVRDLVVEAQAFKNAGLGANFLGTAANLMDRAMDPMSATAKKSTEIFREMGISMPELRTKNFYEQIQLLQAGLERLPNQAARVDAMIKLFGRFQGGQMLQLLGDPEALSRAEQQAGRLGDRMEQDAAAFAHAEHALNGVGVRMRELYVAAAEQVLPTLESIASLIGGMNLSGLGTVLGAAGPSAVGGLAGMWGVNKLDSALLNTAEKFGGTMRGEIAATAASVTGVLATALPVGLAAGITAQIVLGILDAMNRDEIRDIFNQARNAHKEVGEKVGAMKAATTAKDFEAGRVETVAALEKAQIELAALRAQKATDDAKMAAFAGNTREGADVNFPKMAMTDADTARMGELEIEVRKLALAARDALDPLKRDSTIAANQLKAAQDAVAPLVANMAELIKKNVELSTKEMDPAPRSRALRGQAADLQNQINTIPEGFNAEQRKAKLLDLENKLLKVQIEQRETTKQIEEGLKKITGEKERQEIFALTTQMLDAKATGNTERENSLKREIQAKQAIAGLSGKDLELAQQRLPVEEKLAALETARAAARVAIDAERTALENNLNVIREKLALLQGDYTRTDSAKWGERKKAIEEEIATLKAAIAADQLAAKNSTDSVSRQLFEKSAASKGHSLAGAQGELAGLGPNPNSWIENTKKSLNDLLNQIGTTSQRIGHSIASTIGGAFDSVSQNITQALVVTGNWGQALGNIRTTILTSIVGSFVDMGVRWVETLAIMGVKWIATKLGLAAADKAIAAANIAALIPIATATSLVWAAPAALATIATFGGAAAAAPGEVALAMMGTSMLALSGASEGGYFPGDPKKVRGYFHGDEVIFSAPAVRNLGAENLLALHRAGLTGGTRSGGTGGGAAGMAALGGGSRESPRNMHFYWDPRSYARAMQEHSGDYFRQIAREEIKAAS